METASLVAAGWASGVNAYLTVLVLAIAGRAGWADVPDSIERPWVIAAAAVMFAIEFVVDKVALLDSAWDVAHTLIRPTVGAALGAAIAGAELGEWEASLLAGSLALVGHAAKATTRLTINLSPEPATNVVASFAEDGLVTGLVVLAITRPRLAGRARDRGHDRVDRGGDRPDPRAPARLAPAARSVATGCADRGPLTRSVRAVWSICVTRTAKRGHPAARCARHPDGVSASDDIASAVRTMGAPHAGSRRSADTSEGDCV